jgi:hypothetical protein
MLWYLVLDGSDEAEMTVQVGKAKLRRYWTSNHSTTHRMLLTHTQTPLLRISGLLDKTQAALNKPDRLNGKEWVQDPQRMA